MEANVEEFELMDEWTEWAIMSDATDSNSFNVTQGVVVEAPWKKPEFRGSLVRVIIDKDLYDIPDLDDGDPMSEISSDFRDLEQAIEKYTNGSMSSFSFDSTFETEDVVFFEYN